MTAEALAHLVKRLGNVERERVLLTLIDWGHDIEGAICHVLNGNNEDQ